MPSAEAQHREEHDRGERTEQVPIIVSPWLDEPRACVVEGELAGNIAAAVRGQRSFGFTDDLHPGRHFAWDAAKWQLFDRWAAAAVPHYGRGNWVLRVEAIAEGGVDDERRCRVRLTIATRRIAG